MLQLQIGHIQTLLDFMGMSGIKYSSNHRRDLADCTAAANEVEKWLTRVERHFHEVLTVMAYGAQSRGEVSLWLDLGRTTDYRKGSGQDCTGRERRLHEHTYYRQAY